ncbi:MAG: prefoldin subunit beta [Acidilobaceae archaeon]|nr:prefoldin subunit beta [Acidilobaceae archaeon]
MVERLPPEVEAKYTKYVKVRDALTAVSQERITIENTLGEIEELLERIGKLSQDVELYKMMGYVLVKASRDDVIGELRERKEELELRLKAVKAQEEHLRKELERLSGELRSLIGSGGAG